MAVDFNDVQALVRSGFGSLGGARYVLLRIVDATRAKAWLARAEPTRASQVGGAHDLRCAMQIAFTRAGLIAAGFDEAELETMAPEFLDGMASDGRRSHRLGDVGESAPEHWNWGVGAREPHALIMLLAKKTMIADWASGIEAAALANGFAPVASFDSCPAREDGDASHEPFGFADGVSQPKIDWNGERSISPSANHDYNPLIAAGEILLGHSNEYGVSAGDANGALVQRNGSYLVYRQLEQDVTGFWQWAAEAAGPENARWMAERVVGRGIDGSPLPGLATSGGRDDFLFKGDPDGIVCPLGSHIRRANPRSGDNPHGRRGFLRDLVSAVGLAGKATDDPVASARFHRILRRGRPYGTTITPELAMLPELPHVEAGLHFLCLNASLARQFEFIQGAWLISPTFGGLSQEDDPLLGSRCPFPDDRRTDLFRYHDAHGVPRIAQDMPRFVTVRGGAYFFLPSITGLMSIASR
ncbi:peroxidase [Neorhizobium sp. SHOUNA12A]|uniref:Dyp-type peroxidase n=1 Tax=Neorhizobium sp. SHOUNA12A TaxID=2908923 RepID=UPI001FF346C8|nr:peroxidase [Neorhizobium sp. SHOUNA12A]MCJ9749056.1 peroxidase [Neorhizobium sp. SHOUNA12A]